MCIAALEAAKDEKQSLSSSLEMHVDLTLQLQQEVDEMKSSLVCCYYMRTRHSSLSQIVWTLTILLLFETLSSLGQKAGCEQRKEISCHEPR